MGLNDRLPYTFFGRPEGQRFLILIFAAFYLLGCCTPLRLEMDCGLFFDARFRIPVVPYMAMMLGALSGVSPGSGGLRGVSAARAAF
ncbi:MAG TPA: hypothetical protein VL727_10035 [Puia sp.]|jgi:hypothetical protein|nr:hypothetical protein [Puia sp.]